MNEQASARVRRLVAWLHKNRRDLTEGGKPSPTKIAAETGKKVSYWSDVLRGDAKSFGAVAARAVEDALKIPPFTLEGLDIDQHPFRGVAHSLGEIQATMPPITIEWERVLSLPLPERFQLQIRDRAMEGRESRGLRAGDYAIFTTDRRHEPGEVVLIADKDGNLYVRTYQERRPGHWQGVATSPHVQPLDSLEDGLTVLAVMCGHTW